MLINTNPLVRKAIKDFSGPLAEKILDGAHFDNEELVGEMNEEEKILWTIHENLKSEGNKIAIELCGKAIDNMNQSELMACSEKIEQKASKEQKDRLIIAKKEGDLIYKALFESITSRLIKGTNYNSVVIRQGWQVYAGNREGCGNSTGAIIMFRTEGDRIVFR